MNRSRLALSLAAGSAVLAWAPVQAEDGEAANAHHAQTVIDLSAAELRELMARQDIRLIDVRRPDEVAQGVITGAEHIELSAFDPASLDQSDGRKIVLYCRSGRRSRIAAEALAAFTGDPARHLAGGVIAWEASGGTIETP